MKIRMRGNSLRLRLTRSEVALVAEQGSVRERIEFPDGAELVYELKCAADLGGIAAAFANGTITVFAPRELAREWALSERVGMASEAGPLTILIEKDFQCAHGEKDPDAFEGEAEGMAP